MFHCQHCHRAFNYNFEMKIHIEIEHRILPCLSCHVVFESHGKLNSHLWANESCKILHSIQYGLEKDEINREKEKRSIDIYIERVDHFRSSLSKLQNLTEAVLNNSVEIKYFSLCNAYNINDLSIGHLEKTNHKTKLNALKTNLFTNFKELEKHLFTMKSSLSLVNPSCSQKGCYSMHTTNKTKLCSHQSWFR